MGHEGKPEPEKSRNKGGKPSPQVAARRKMYSNSYLSYYRKLPKNRGSSTPAAVEGENMES